jgi:hypothetical protein
MMRCAYQAVQPLNVVYTCLKYWFGTIPMIIYRAIAKWVAVRKLGYQDMDTAAIQGESVKSSSWESMWHCSDRRLGRSHII